MIIRRSSTLTVLTGIFLSTLLPGVIAMAAAGAHYPDVDIQVISDEHLIIKYSPLLSDDLATLGRASLYPVGDREVWGRVLLLALPPGGEISYTVNFSRAGSARTDALDRYITEDMPLVTRGAYFEARGHRLVRLVIFPHRQETDYLAVYKDFVIDVFLTPSNQAADPAPGLSRLDSVLAVSVINSGQFYRFGTAARKHVFLKDKSNPFDGTRNWVRIAVEESGITRINGSSLEGAGIDLIDLHSDSLRMYYAGGVNPPDTLTDYELDFHEIAIMVDDADDGFFNSGDFILFYAQAPDRYEFPADTPVYIKNNYNDKNYYWLTTSGTNGDPSKRWSWIDGRLLSSPDYIASVTRQLVRFEQEHVIKVDGDGRIRNYYDWFWSGQPEQIVTINLPELMPGDSVDIRMGAVSSYNSTSLSLNGTPLDKGLISNNYFHFWDNVGAAVAGINNVRINIYHVSGYYLDYLEVDYPRLLHLAGPQLNLNSTGYAGFVHYMITGYTPSHYVLDITDPDMVYEVRGVIIEGDTARFQRPESPAAMSRYIIYSPSSVLTPLAVEAVDPANLRDDLDQYDCITIAPHGFHGALEEYANYRAATGGYRVKLVDVEDIYNNFGYGLISPMAIRNYLRFAFIEFDPPAPFAVLLVGDGHYDFLDNLGRHTPSFIPPFIWPIEYSVGDDNYVYFGDFGRLDSDSSYINQSDRGWDMMVTRWPVRSSSEITSHIEALKNYESLENGGDWRTRITYVADDEFKGDIESEIIHTAMAETLAVMYTPAEFVKEKIYATEYPFASNGEKPTVNDAIIKAVNEGTLILDYIGHGSPDVWADEHILKKSSDLSRMQNADRLMTVIAGSCSIGFFDDPGQEGMAEILFRQRGGAIETVSATRLVYASDNAIFNYDLFDALFGNRCNTAEAVYAAKVFHQYSYNYSLIRNDRAYVVFGDPLSQVGLPEYSLEFAVETDTLLTPLQYFGFTGNVLDGEGNPMAVDGLIEMTAYDSRIIKHHELGIDYSLGGPVIFRGSVPVTAGMFEGGFIVPLDIDYGGNAAQLKGYGSFQGVTGIGALESLTIATGAAPTSDNTGPEIYYSFPDVPDFVSGDRIPPNATVALELTDESGINLTGGLGHRIELVVDNDNNTTLNLTDLFSYTSGSYQSGDLTFALPDLSRERHSFRIRAWDNANNPATIEFEAIPSREGKIAIYDVMNYPNPMEESTEFFFMLSESAEWVELKIFTLSGKMIKDFRSHDLAVGKNRRFYWDGRDLDGDRVAEGVYIYKISAKGRLAEGSRTADNVAEAFGKLVLLN